MKLQSKKIAIIGSNGFIGSSLNKYLQTKKFSTLLFNSDNPLIVNSELNNQILEANVIVWCASRVNPVTANKREDLLEKEIEEWKTILNFLEKRFKFGGKLIYLSSGGCTYTSGNLPFSEDSEAFGTNKYGKLKIAMEEELFSRDISSIILRVANVYGPGQPHGRGQGVIAEWKNAIESDSDIEVFGPTESFRDYIFIDDLCEGILQSFSINCFQEMFNLGSGIPTDLKTLLAIVNEIKSGNSNIVFHEKRAIDRMGYFLDVSKFTTYSSWTPAISVETGLRETFERNK